MSDIQVQQTNDRALVRDLLTRWKSDHAHAFVRPGGRMVYLIAWLGHVADPVGVLVGTHDFANWDILEKYEHLREDTRGSYVQAMFVDPAFRSKRIGRSLLEVFIAQAETAGSPVVVAWPDEEDEGRAARLRFFERNGFAFLAYPGGVREPWLMGRPLS